MIRAALSGQLDKVTYETDPVFNLDVPSRCPGVPEHVGSIKGDPTTLPWGIVFPGVPGGPRQPLQLYEIAGTTLILGWVLRAAGRRPFDGYLFWSGIIASSALRFMLDLLRSEDRTVIFLTWGQMAALGLIVWGSWFLWTHARRGRTRPNPSKEAGGR